MEDHVRIAAILRIVYSAFGLLLSAVFFLFMGGLGAGLGALAFPPFGALIGFFFGLLAIYSAICAVPGLLTGWGMLRFRPWGRILGIVFAAIDLFAFPVGTALGVYTLWVLFHPQTIELFEYGGPVPYSRY